MQTGNANVLLLLIVQQTYLRAVVQVHQAEAGRLDSGAGRSLASDIGINVNIRCVVKSGDSPAFGKLHIDLTMR
jgi:hypothetical protein